MSRLKGNLAEQKAFDFLVSKQYKIIEVNFYAKKIGEIDIIASKNNIYHFCEVKSAIDYETAINNITPNKLFKLKKSIYYYLQIKKIDISYTLDVIIVVKGVVVSHLENVTL